MASHCVITSASVRGRREYQADRFLVAPVNVPVRCGTGHLLAVMDGHGGDDLSNFLAEVIPARFEKEHLRAKGNPEKALLRLFEGLSTDTARQGNGSTLSLVYIPRRGRRAYVAILGDSPVIIFHPDLGHWMSPEHNVTNEAECERVRSRGGYRRGAYFYTNGGSYGLQLSRALGDFRLAGILDRTPEIFKVGIRSGSVILVATDGITDHNKESAERIKALVENISEDGISAEDVVRAALPFSNDNITAIVWRRP